MPTERLSMRDVREILRQKWLLERSHRAISDSVGASAGIVSETIKRAKAAGVTKVAFDRSGFKYHGRVKALADAARAAGLEF